VGMENKKGEPNFRGGERFFEGSGEKKMKGG
jgi:hypothetical protein